MPIFQQNYLIEQPNYEDFSKGDFPALFIGEPNKNNV